MDIAERLRDEAKYGWHLAANRQSATRDLHRDALAEIEQLRAALKMAQRRIGQLERIVESLAPNGAIPDHGHERLIAAAEELLSLGILNPTGSVKFETAKAALRAAVQDALNAEPFTYDQHFAETMGQDG